MLKPSASNEVYLDEVTKRALSHLIFFQLKSSQEIIETHQLLRKEVDAFYDEDVISKHKERASKEANLLARVVSMKEDNSEALDAAYHELLDILKVSDDPEAWNRVQSAREYNRD